MKVVRLKQIGYDVDAGQIYQTNISLSQIVQRIMRLVYLSCGKHFVWHLCLTSHIPKI